MCLFPSLTLTLELCMTRNVSHSDSQETDLRHKLTNQQSTRMPWRSTLPKATGSKTSQDAAELWHSCKLSSPARAVPESCLPGAEDIRSLPPLL